MLSRLTSRVSTAAATLRSSFAATTPAAAARGQPLARRTFASAAASPSASSGSHARSSARRLLALGVGAVGGAAAVVLAASIDTALTVGHDHHDEEIHKHAVATKTWRYYSGPGGDMENLRLFTGNSNPELAREIAQYLGLSLSPATVDRFSDGECKIQVNTNVRQTHCFVIQPTSSPVNDSLMELLLLVSTLRRASAQEITAVIPYYGYSRQDRKMASRVPISAADVALLLEEMGVDRVVSVDLHGGQIQGFFPPSVPVENLEATPIGALYFSEKHLRKPVIVAASAGGVLRAKKFRETLVEQGIDADMAMLIEARDTDVAGRFANESAGVLDLVGTVKGCDCILIEDIIDTATTMQHAAEELKRQNCRNVYAFVTHGLFSTPGSAEKIEASPIKELVTTNTVAMGAEAERIQKITVLTLAPLLAEAIRRIYLRTSISGLYTNPITKPANADGAQARPEAKKQA